MPVAEERADLKGAIHSPYVRDPSGNIIELKSGV
jgi:hypothetical protein